MKKISLHYYNFFGPVLGPHPSMYTMSEKYKITGNCSKILGDCTHLEGDISLIEGDVTPFYGNCTDIRGNVDKETVYWTPDTKPKHDIRLVLLEETLKEAKRGMR